MGALLRRCRAYWTTLQPAAPGAPVTGVEMIYDVMKAFAFSQVDTLILRDPTGHGFLHGLLILAVAWGCWVSYVWAANALRADVGIFRGLHFVALVALTLLGLTLPLAFSGTGLHLR